MSHYLLILTISARDYVENQGKSLSEYQLVPLTSESLIRSKAENNLVQLARDKKCDAVVDVNEFVFSNVKGIHFCLRGTGVKYLTLENL